MSTKARLLFSPAAIAAHTVLFTPVVGSLMAARNWRRLGDVARARKTAALGIGGTALLALVSALWPDRWGGGAIQGGVTGATIALAVTFYREAKEPFAAHLADGGQKAAWWPATLGGLALVGAFIGALLAATLLEPGHAEFQAGVDALARNDNGEAERDFLRVLAVAPQDEGARFNLALALARQGRSDEARAQLQKISPGSPFVENARRLLNQLDRPPAPR